MDGAQKPNAKKTNTSDEKKFPWEVNQVPTEVKEAFLRRLREKEKEGEAAVDAMLNEATSNHHLGLNSAEMELPFWVAQRKFEEECAEEEAFVRNSKVWGNGISLTPISAERLSVAEWDKSKSK